MEALRLYLALFRPHLDYTVQFLSPYQRMNNNMFESVQRWMVKMIQVLINLICNNSHERLNLHYLERRRVWGYFIKVYNWMKDIIKGDVNKVPVREQVKTAINRFKLDKLSFKENM